MKLSNHSAVPVYTISGSSTARPLPEWLARKRKRSLKNDPEYASRVELLQDFEFEEASQCVRVSEDGQWVMSTDLKYDKRSTEALIPAVGVNEKGNGEVFRLNLEVGRYMRGYELDVGGDDSTSSGRGALQGGINTGSVNTAAVAEDSHNLLAFGTSLGSVEFWDPRAKGRMGIIQSPRQSGLVEGRQEVTALEFDRSGLSLATGSSTGLIHLYDLRSPNPILKKDQGYGYPVQTLIYLSPSTSARAQTSEPKILSADKRIIKIWSQEDGAPWTSVEPAVDINSVAWCKDSGMLLTANEGRQQHSFFIPQLGPAPKWCSFLDNLVEEMAEDPNDPNAFTGHKAGEVYDNYKFLTVQQLESLNLSHLIGTTSLLRPYMHGYFVAQRLYEEAKMIADPFVWEEERNKRVKDKIDTERESRIRGNKKVTAKVNKRLAEKMAEREEREERREARRVLEKGGEHEQAAEAVSAVDVEGRKQPGSLLNDSRFARLFQDEDFAIDERSREFQSLNPSTKPTSAEPSSRHERGLTAVEEEALAENLHSSSSGESSEGGEKSPPKAKDNGRLSSTSYKRSGHRTQQQPQMRITSSKKPQQAKDPSFGSRAERSKTARPTTTRAVGEREIIFAPERKGKSQKSEPSERRRDRGRRSASGNVFRNM
ncbi:ribosome biogenesis protein ENP2, partial [Lecanoromycetidae sp. Uapishka_2]